MNSLLFFYYFFKNLIIFNPTEKNYFSNKNFKYFSKNSKKDYFFKKLYKIT